MIDKLTTDVMFTTFLNLRATKIVAVQVNLAHSLSISSRPEKISEDIVWIILLVTKFDWCATIMERGVYQTKYQM